MKTIKKVPVELVRVETMPKVMEFGKLYYSEKYRGLAHLCLCGCGERTYIPINKEGWELTENKGKVTISPSLFHRFKCKSHYIIINNVANFV